MLYSGGWQLGEKANSKTNSEDPAQPWKVLKGESFGEGVRAFIIFYCVQTYFCLVGGEVTEWCSRNLVFSVKLPSTTCMGVLVPTEELEGIAIYMFLEEEPGLSATAALLILDCSISFCPSFPISNCLHLPFGTQGRPGSLNETSFLQTRDGRPRKDLYRRGPHRVMLCLLSLLFPSFLLWV